jgi:hypothetical protein
MSDDVILAYRRLSVLCSHFGITVDTVERGERPGRPAKRGMLDTKSSVTAGLYTLPQLHTSTLL